MLKKISIISLLILSGCASVEQKNPDIEYEKAASLVCAGDYKVYRNGDVSNESLEAFSETNVLFNELPVVAQNNYLELEQCLFIAVRYFKDIDIKASEHTDQEMLEIRKDFIKEMNKINFDYTVGEIF